MHVCFVEDVRNQSHAHTVNASSRVVLESSAPLAQSHSCPTSARGMFTPFIAIQSMCFCTRGHARTASHSKRTNARTSSRQSEDTNECPQREQYLPIRPGHVRQRVAKPAPAGNTVQRFARAACPCIKMRSVHATSTCTHNGCTRAAGTCAIASVRARRTCKCSHSRTTPLGARARVRSPAGAAAATARATSAPPPPQQYTHTAASAALCVRCQRAAPLRTARGARLSAGSEGSWPAPYEFQSYVALR